jgi:hypothetical protein
LAVALRQARVVISGSVTTDVGAGAERVSLDGSVGGKWLDAIFDGEISETE